MRSLMLRCSPLSVSLNRVLELFDDIGGFLRLSARIRRCAVDNIWIQSMPRSLTLQASPSKNRMEPDLRKLTFPRSICLTHAAHLESYRSNTQFLKSIPVNPLLLQELPSFVVLLESTYRILTFRQLEEWKHIGPQRSKRCYCSQYAFALWSIDQLGQQRSTR
jgi:hypothetical protein